MDKYQTDSDAAGQERRADAPQGNGSPLAFGDRTHYCMRCRKHFATHVTLGARGRKQYRCDECFEGGKKG